MKNENIHRLASLLAVLACAACATSRIDRVRFANEPPIEEVSDRLPVSEAPKSRPSAVMLYHFDSLLYKPAIRGTKFRIDQGAVGVNSLDEAPDSSWFENRVRSVSPEDLRAGPNIGPGPMAHKPWSIVSSKTDGAAPGFIIKDTTGSRYLLKFDAPGAPENESGAHIVLHRLLWALGYNVPEDRIVSLERGDLVLDADAVSKDSFGNERPLTDADVETILKGSHRDPGKPYRATVSKFVPGKPLGGFPDAGVRHDDPNDKIPHELRRELRGLAPIFAWLKHTDVKEANTLDAFVTDEERGGRQYVRHYLIDFGKALGIIARQSGFKSDGYSRWIDGGEAALSLVALGLNPRQWDDLESPKGRGLGLFEIEGYHPGKFETRSPYPAFEAADQRDMFWGSKLMMQLSEKHIRAAVETAEYTEEATREYLIRALVARQRKTARYWFMRANPLDSFEVVNDESNAGSMTFGLCFEDLVRRYRLQGDRLLSATRYGATVHDYAGNRLAYKARITLSVVTERVCIEQIPSGAENDNYTIVAVDTARPGASYEPVLVHIATDQQTKKRRVIGIRRLDR